MDKADNLKNILKALRSELPAMQATLKTFVCAESPSTEKAAADVCAAIVAKHWGNTGARVELVEQKYRGAHVRIAYATGSAAAAKGQILVLGHYDTVYASGT